MPTQRVPAPRRKPILVRWPPAMSEALTMLAERKATTVADLIRRAVIDTYNLEEI